MKFVRVEEEASAVASALLADPRSMSLSAVYAAVGGPGENAGACVLVTVTGIDVELLLRFARGLSLQGELEERSA